MKLDILKPLDELAKVSARDLTRICFIKPASRGAAKRPCDKNMVRDFLARMCGIKAIIIFVALKVYETVKIL